jgi:hypothetical protein
VRRTLGALAAVALLGACGTSETAPSPQALDRQWLANTRGVVAQLRHDLMLIHVSGRSLPAARAALRSDSDLYALLLAYSDFGGCRRMIAGAGPPAQSASRLELTLAHACARLQRGAALFTRAVSRSDAEALLAASRAAGGASPLLVRATLQLDRLGPRQSRYSSSRTSRTTTRTVPSP